MKKAFDFKGSNLSKFRIAGANYIRKVVRLNRPLEVLLSYTTNNYGEVCEDGISKGFCTGQCRFCMVQQAYNDTISLCAMKAQREILADKLTLKERSGKTWEEFRNEMN